MQIRAQANQTELPVLARLLRDGEFLTPRGNTHWWPAQVQQLLQGAYDSHYVALTERPRVKMRIPEVTAHADALSVHS